MKPQTKRSLLPEDHFLNQLYTSPTFKWLKIEMEGNQEDYDIDDDPTYFENMLLENAGVRRSDLQYIQAYNDGSVDTEVTFTVPLTPAGVEISKTLMSTFEGMIDDIDKAGMHITLMPDNPYTDREPLLTDKGIENLQKQLDPILLWIQLLGQASSMHRGAGYCTNRVGFDKQGYSAVNIQERKRIEFRFFHPCYNNTDVLDHYLEVIARMLEFYENPSKKVVLHGGSGVYRVLQGTDEFNHYLRMSGDKGVKSLAFSDIYHQFTGKHTAAWQRVTGFKPTTLAQHWSNPEYREALKEHKVSESIARQRLTKQGAKWLTQDKASLYDGINLKVMKELNL